MTHKNNSMPRQVRLIAGVALACLFGAAGCRNSARHYTLHGRVLGKDQTSARITVDNDNIAGFMPAMTMSYSVRDRAGLQRVAPGDRIAAELIAVSNQYWLEHVTVTDRSKQGTMSATQPHELLPGEPVPDVPLSNQDGRIVHLSDFRGKAVLLTFIYTRCPFPAFCPLLTSRFAKVHRTLAQDPALYRGTQLVSVSLDPDYDTPPVLRKYGLDYLQGDAAGFAQWEFVSTSPADLQKLAAAFSLAYYRENNQIAHSLNTILLSPDGTVKQTWPGNDWTWSQVVGAIKAAAL